jgi:hypothetical protein
MEIYTFVYLDFALQALGVILLAASVGNLYLLLLHLV